MLLRLSPFCPRGLSLLAHADHAFLAMISIISGAINMESSLDSTSGHTFKNVSLSSERSRPMSTRFREYIFKNDAGHCHTICPGLESFEIAPV